MKNSLALQYSDPGNSFVFWRITESLEDISNRNVNTTLTVPSFFLPARRERSHLKMNYKAIKLEVIMGITPSLHRV